MRRLPLSLMRSCSSRVPSNVNVQVKDEAQNPHHPHHNDPRPPQWFATAFDTAICFKGCHFDPTTTAQPPGQSPSMWRVWVAAFISIFTASEGSYTCTLKGHCESYEPAIYLVYTRSLLDCSVARAVLVFLQHHVIISINPKTWIGAVECHTRLK